MTRTYSRDDIQTHREGFYGGEMPAVNVKVYRDIRDAWEAFEREEEPDSRFTLDWIEENVSDETLDGTFWHCCEFEFEYLEAWATGAEGDSLFPDDRVELAREGRSGGWVVVRGLPDLEEWDAVRLARWRKFERIAREIADGIPFQMLASLYLNEFEAWADREDDAAAYNAEAPIDEALAAI